MAVVPVLTQLTNNGSKAMNVVGSLQNPVTFSYSPGSDQNGANGAELIALTMLIESTGTDTFSKFGKISSLTNGILINVTIGGMTSTICTIKDNSDLVTFFSQNNNFGSSAQGTLGAAIGFGASVDAYIGTIFFNDSSMVLSGTDSISIVVQDDLSSISTLVCSLQSLLQAA